MFAKYRRFSVFIRIQTVAYDLIENAVQFVGEDDGVFNNSDYLLFYAIGPKSFNQENNSHINPYSDKAYYYVQISNGNGLRMNAANAPTGTANATFSTFHDYKFVESDTYNIGQMGRRWFGHRFYFENARTFTFDFPNLVTQNPLKLKILALADKKFGKMELIKYVLLISLILLILLILLNFFLWNIFISG